MKDLKYFENYQNVTQRHEVRKCCWEKDAGRLAPHRVATNLQFVKNVIYVKFNKAKHNKTRYAHTRKLKILQMAHIILLLDNTRLGGSVHTCPQACISAPHW